MGGTSSSARNYSSVDEGGDEEDAFAGEELSLPYIDYGATDIIGRRRGMEDAYCDHPDMNATHPELRAALGGPGVRRGLYGVFDGHGGRQCSEYVADHLLEHLVRELVKAGEGDSELELHGHARPALIRRYSSQLTGVTEGVQTAVLNALLSVERAYGAAAKRQYDENEMKKHRIRRSERMFRQGTCATVVYLQDDLLVCANVGDSRTVLCRGGKSFDLSDDHKPGRPDERRRIELAGGEVRRDRNTCFDRLNARYPLCAMAVERSKWLSSFFAYMNWTSRAPLRVYPGAIAIARALGDCYLKDPYYDYLKPEEGCTAVLSPVPDIVVTHVNGDSEFVILGCDGVWDVMSSADAVRLIRRAKCATAQQASDLLVQTAFDMGSGDNISVIVIFLAKWHRAVTDDHAGGGYHVPFSSAEGGSGVSVGSSSFGDRPPPEVTPTVDALEIAAAVAEAEMSEVDLIGDDSVFSLPPESKRNTAEDAGANAASSAV